jgi:hypothetical protein
MTTNKKFKDHGLRSKKHRNGKTMMKFDTIKSKKKPNSVIKTKIM